ncbi:lasso RiPP family leader peptide-containing protein [Streptomyces alkaliterrae]|nr:lasso RiPP family leader peptide-containing protein [Streptomyces alkaliterrae]MBB1258888.1 lasso RiPP family leader peptide-containing protein [Streptomyces alkaliterrae]MQS00863.1 lasso RiPP family leader peptide-containing protein [Streptomyces alkaliterrae]
MAKRVYERPELVLVGSFGDLTRANRRGMGFDWYLTRK